MRPNDPKQSLENDYESKEEEITSRSPLIPHMSSAEDETTPEQPSQTPLPAQTESPAESAKSSPPQMPMKQSGKNVSLPLAIMFLIISFLCGLLLALWYFQNQLELLKTVQKQPQEMSAPKTMLIIGTDATIPPMEYIDENGRIIGYDVDLGNRLAAEMGRKAEIRNIAWDDLFTALQDQKIDIIISSVSITDERKKLYAFSNPYMNAGQVIISRKDAPISQTKQLRGKKIAVQSNTTNEKEAHKYTASELVIAYQEYITIGEAVSVGSADAALADLALAKGILQNHENIKITSDPLTNEYYGIVMRKDNQQMQTDVNKALQILRVKGYLTDLQQKWLD